MLEARVELDWEYVAGPGLYVTNPVSYSLTCVRTVVESNPSFEAGFKTKPSSGSGLVCDALRI
jgi:hypothetical protein